MMAVKRIAPERSCGLLIDVQGFFLSQVDKRRRPAIKTNTGYFLRLLDAFDMPVVATLERPLDVKGSLPKEIAKHMPDRARTFAKSTFDLCKEAEIRNHLEGLKRPQMIVAGCETDVCVLQSCLGLIELGYEVYVVEELIFSSAVNVDSAIARMKSAGVIFLSYKSLYYELLESVEGKPLPDDLPDAAVH